MDVLELVSFALFMDFSLHCVIFLAGDGGLLLLIRQERDLAGTPKQTYKTNLSKKRRNNNNYTTKRQTKIVT